jgi:hypothetical protein
LFVFSLEYKRFLRNDKKLCDPFDGFVAQQYKQTGNVVPINLRKEVGYSIVNFLNKYYHCIN